MANFTAFDCAYQVSPQSDINKVGVQRTLFPLQFWLSKEKKSITVVDTPSKKNQNFQKLIFLGPGKRFEAYFDNLITLDVILIQIII